VFTLIIKTLTVLNLIDRFVLTNVTLAVDRFFAATSAPRDARVRRRVSELPQFEGFIQDESERKSCLETVP
jgi:hypothetical protein